MTEAKTVRLPNFRPKLCKNCRNRFLLTNCARGCIIIADVHLFGRTYMKNKITVLCTLAIAVLLLSSAIAPFLSFATVNADSVDIGPKFTEGKFTSQAIYTEEYRIGIPWLIEYLLNRRDIVFIDTVQSLERELELREERLIKQQTEISVLRNEIAILETQITASPGNDALKESLKKREARVLKLSEEEKLNSEAIEAATEKLSVTLESYGTEEDTELLYQKLGEKDFSRICSTYFFLDGEARWNIRELDSDTPDDAAVYSRIKSVMFLICSLLCFVFAVIGAAIFITRALAAVLKLKNRRGELGEYSLFCDISAGLSVWFIGGMLTAVTFFAVLCGGGASLGAGAVLIIICASVSAVICAAVRAFDASFEKKAVLIESITAIALFAVIISAVCLSSLSMLGKYENASEKMREGCVALLSEEYVSELKPDDFENESEYNAARTKAMSDAKKDAERKVGLQMIYAYATAVIFPAVACFGATSLAARLVRGRHVKHRRQALALCVSFLLILCSSLPLIKTVGTPEERQEAIASGNFAVLLDAHAHEGTLEAGELSSELTARENLLLQIEELRKDYRKSKNSEQKEYIQKILEATSIDEKRVRANISLMNTHERAALVFAIIASCVAVGLEAAYIVLVKKRTENIK